MIRKFTMALIASAFALAFTGCGSEQSSSPSAASTLAETAPSGDVSEASDVGDFAAPDLPVGTVEGLVMSSDFVIEVSATTSLLTLQESPIPTLQLASITPGKVYRGDDRQSSLAVFVSPDMLERLTVPGALVFLRAATTTLEGEFAKYGNPYTLTPGANSVLTPDGDSYRSIGGGFTGVAADSPSATVNKDGQVESMPQGELVSRAAVLEVLQALKDGPTVTLAPPSTVSSEDAGWLATLDAQCAEARAGAASLNQLLTSTYEAGKWDEGAADDAVRLFAELVGSLGTLEVVPGLSPELLSAVAKAKAALSSAEDALALAKSLRGDELKNQIGLVGWQVNNFQLAFVGLEASNCKQFV